MYKVGDRVNINASCYSFDHLARTGTVAEVLIDGMVSLMIDREEGMKAEICDETWLYYPSEVSPIKAKTDTKENKVKQKSKPTIPAGKALYVVKTREGEIFDSTEDRDEAREIKQLLGGKAEGVTITRYAPVKEIR